MLELRKLINKALYFGLCLILVLTISTPSKELDRIIAIVNTTAITQTQLDNALNHFSENQYEQLTDEQERLLFQEQVLNLLVERTLLFQIAIESGIEHEYEQLDQLVIEQMNKDGFDNEVDWEKWIQRNFGVNRDYYVGWLTVNFVIDEYLFRTIQSQVRVSQSIRDFIGGLERAQVQNEVAWDMQALVLPEEQFSDGQLDKQELVNLLENSLDKPSVELAAIDPELLESLTIDLNQQLGLRTTFQTEDSLTKIVATPELTDLNLQILQFERKEIDSLPEEYVLVLQSVPNGSLIYPLELPSGIHILYKQYGYQPAEKVVGNVLEISRLIVPNAVEQSEHDELLMQISKLTNYQSIDNYVKNFNAVSQIEEQVVSELWGSNILEEMPNNLQAVLQNLQARDFAPAISGNDFTEYLYILSRDKIFSTQLEELQISSKLLAERREFQRQAHINQLLQNASINIY